MPVTELYRPDPVYPNVGEGYYDAVEAASFPKHVVRYRNQKWAARVGLDGLDDGEWIDHFGRFKALPSNLRTPLAMRYHGHQFQAYNPQIGDGRGFLFAQMRDNVDGRLLDLGTKGSGQTPYSRFGDGRLTLKGGVREVLITALLEALGVYTSKSFSLIETGESLYRNDEPSPTRSSVLVRLSHSHIRFGSFQRHAFEGSHERLHGLVNHCVDQYYPELSEFEGEAKIGAFVNAVSERSAQMTASWMAAGFVHGVLNTDNMNVTGESFDYGPYRMLAKYEPGFVAAYFDESGLYAFGRQPNIVFWNLKQFAGALSVVCSKDILVSALESFPKVYQSALHDRLFERMGLRPGAWEDGVVFVDTVFPFMQKSKVPFEQYFFDWYGGMASEDRAAKSPVASLYQSPEFKKVKDLMVRYEPSDVRRLSHAYFARPHPATLIIDEIETLWSKIAEHDDWSLFNDKLNAFEEMRCALQDPHP